MALTDSLISFWELEEASGTRVDAHGSNDLTDNNTVLSATGKVGDAADFELSNSEYLSHASNSDLQCGNIDFTIGAWVKFESISGGNVIIGKDTSTGSQRDYTLDYDSGSDNKFRFYVNGTIIAKSTAASTGTWYFVVGWHDASADTVNIQVNNATPVSTATGGVAPHSSSSEFRIGARQYPGFNHFFDGLIDQAFLFKRVLTSDERTTLYNSGNGVAYADLGGGGGSGVGGRLLDCKLVRGILVG